jgi:hypothetical protein
MWWLEEIGLGVRRCPLPSLELCLYGSDWDGSVRHRPATLDRLRSFRR